MATATPLLRIEKLVKRYGDRTVLRQIDLAVEAGQAVGLVGVNGAGKTTLLKCMLDFVSYDSGTITICGRSATDTAARSALAYLPERFVPPYYLSGHDFLSFMTGLYGVDLDRDRLLDLLPAVDLNAAALELPVRQLSKGMAQKLGILSCLLSDRPLLIMDEPMSGLDPKARACIKHHLASLRNEGRTLFFSTHLLYDVESQCDRVAILHEGVLAFHGTPEECCRRFASNTLEQAYLRCVGSAPGGPI